MALMCTISIFVELLKTIWFITAFLLRQRTVLSTGCLRQYIRLLVQYTQTGRTTTSADGYMATIFHITYHHFSTVNLPGVMGIFIL